MPLLDNTLPLLLEGYAWLPGLRRRTGRDIVHTRVLGQRAVGLCGPEAARFFYDEDQAKRLAALDYLVPEQDLTVSLRRVPARMASGFILRPERVRVSPAVGSRSA